MPFKFNPFTNTLDIVESETGTSFIDINQIGHGLSVGEAIYFDGVNWVKAISSNAETIGIALVSEVLDTDNFTATISGPVVGLTGLIAGCWYYVSDTVAGALQDTEGSVFSNPILLATSTTEGIVVSLRADSIEQTIGQTVLSDYDSVETKFFYTGRADKDSNTSDPVWRISRFNFETAVTEYADGNENYDNIYDDRETLTYL
jgi:hypothetical protein